MILKYIIDLNNKVLYIKAIINFLSKDIQILSKAKIKKFKINL